MNIRIALLVLSSFGLSYACRAQMPDTLEGSWILDVEATQAYVKSSPKWKEADAKHLPMVLKRMSQVSYVFEGDAITISARGSAQKLPVTRKSSKAPAYVFEGEKGDDSVRLTVTISEEGNMNIRSSKTDDMDYYLWKRGNLPVVTESK